MHQFALLGNIYAKDVLQVEKPRIGLLNIGEEECKGNDLSLKTFGLLSNEKSFNFGGNCEGRDVLSGNFDVVVCDGFTGNILLKFLESVGGVLLDILRAELPRGRRGKVGSAFLKSNLLRIKKRLDHAEHGGALFPTRDQTRPVLVLDVGANTDCKPSYLHQFALLGNIYAKDVLQVKKPRIGLLNIGEEECKGNELSLIHI